jgi:ATP-dependent DNA helicase Rep
LAGAGSGKTSVITRKISWLVNACDFNPRHVVAVTFTNKAAREMKQRAKTLLGDNAKGLQVSTFHQLGLRILRKEVQRANRKNNFSILDDQDTDALLRDLLLDHGDAASDKVKLYKQQISHWKSQCLDPAQIEGQAQSKAEQRLIELYKRYERALASYNAVDFDDLIALPVKILREHEEARNYWQRSVRYMLVDEYQDTNIGQYALIKLLVAQHHRLTVVGDDDQSIYTWRGANPENLNQLGSDFGDLKVIKLEQNYRSTNRILRSANHLIENNSHIFEKKLWSEKGLGEPIKAMQLPNEEAETEYLCNEVLSKKLLGRNNFKDFAVLVRSNHQSKLLELKLQAKQIPYHVTGGTAFFSRGEIKDVMGYLRVLVNPDDDSAFLRIVNVPRRKIGSSTLEVLGDYANSRDCSLFNAIDEIGLKQQMPEASLKRLRRLSQWFKTLQRNIDNLGANAAIKEMLEDIDYLGWLNQNSSSPSIADRRMENVHFLLRSIDKEMLAMSEANNDQSDESDSLEAVISKLILRDLLDQQSEQEADNKVQVMTLHAAKGLEFPHVFIMGFEEQILPHRNSIESDNIEEERRLAYVGITRAKQTLTLTMAKQRKQFGEHLRCEPSRFLAELPVEDIERSGFGDKPDPAVNAEKGASTLKNLRAMFD